MGRLTPEQIKRAAVVYQEIERLDKVITRLNLARKVSVSAYDDRGDSLSVVTRVRTEKEAQSRKWLEPEAGQMYELLLRFPLRQRAAYLRELNQLDLPEPK